LCVWKLCYVTWYGDQVHSKLIGADILWRVFDIRSTDARF
jgi:hypothetical protein